MTSSRLLVTIDVEALPGRAESDHVARLIWGEHSEGRAGIVEICNILEKFDGVGMFFLEVAGSLNQLAAYREVNSFLESRGHLVEWHFHPEILSRSFWRSKGASAETMRQDLFNAKDAQVILEFGLRQFKIITGRHPRAYRAGSFRWNRHVIDFLAQNDIPYSFNACAETSVRENFETFRPESPRPFLWANGVTEVPCGESSVDHEIIHFRFPRQFPAGLDPNKLAMQLSKASGGPAQLLLHSWSLLKRHENQHFVYAGNARMDALSEMMDGLAMVCPLPSSADEYFGAIDDALKTSTVSVKKGGGPENDIA